jgi:hypothetical protein
VKRKNLLVVGALLATTLSAQADENLFGTLKGAETLPEGAVGFIQHFNQRSDKGQGSYNALDSKTELEYGISNRLTGAVYLLGQSIQTSGLQIDGYLPKDESYGLRASGVEGSLKYNFLSPAKDDFGLAGYLSTGYSWLDPHSGQKKDKFTIETKLLAQKYFLDGQLVWLGNLGMEASMAQRQPIANLPDDFDWPTHPEMEIGFSASTGLSYRFAPNWFIGAEVLYEAEHETEVGRERWSIHAGPSIHYGGKKWWATLSWLPQLRGGGETYAGQADMNLHLVEKTKQEVRFKVGFNF